MRFLRVVVVGVMISGWSNAQTITISGTVNDSFGKGVSGAKVQLEHANLMATTKADGSFRLTGETGADDRPLTSSENHPIRVQGTSLTFTLKKRSKVRLQIYTTNGRNLLTWHYVRGPGTNALDVPQLGAGVYLFSITLGTERYSFTCATFGKVLRSSGVSYESSHVAGLPLKQAGTPVKIDDVLTVDKDGLLTHRITVRNSDTSGIEIKMLPSAGDVTDIDGNVYQSVCIGNQVWAAENLKTTRYNDGTVIAHIPDSAAWYDIYLTGSVTPAYGIYGTDVAKNAKYGVFYNWYAVATGKLAPEGWRVPSDADWDTLENYLIRNGYNYDGTSKDNRIAKSMAAQWDWDSSEIDGAVGNDIELNNASGFSGLPGGLRHWGGSYYSLFLEKLMTYWWSSTEEDSSTAWHRWLDAHHCYLDRIRHHKNTGFAVRIVRDAH